MLLCDRSGESALFTGPQCLLTTHGTHCPSNSPFEFARARYPLNGGFQGTISVPSQRPRPTMLPRRLDKQHMKHSMWSSQCKSTSYRSQRRVQGHLYTADVLAHNFTLAGRTERPARQHCCTSSSLGDACEILNISRWKRTRGRRNTSRPRAA